MKSLMMQDATRIQFDYFVKRVIDSTVKDYHRQIGNRTKHEVPFADLPQAKLKQMGDVDEYEMDGFDFEIGDIAQVNVSHEQLASALHRISDRKRDIVLLHYYLDASDAEIADELNIHSTTSLRNRKKAMAEIRNMIQEE